MDRTAPHNLCNFWMSPLGGPRSEQGWLPTVALSTGKTLDFSVKPGKYTMRFFACQNWWSAEPVVVDATERRGVEVVIAPRVRIGMAHPGFTMVYALTVPNAAPADTGGGEEPAEDPGETPSSAAGRPCKPNGAQSSLGVECCSGKTDVISQYGTTKSVCCASGPRCQ